MGIYFDDDRYECRDFLVNVLGLTESNAEYVLNSRDICSLAEFVKYYRNMRYNMDLGYEDKCRELDG